MKKKIVILGSTGSIGKSTIDIIKKDKSKFEIILLTTNKNIKELHKQAKIFNVKNLIISDLDKYYLYKKKNRNKKIRIFNNFQKLDQIIKKKVDYTMSSISGLDGLEPTLKLIKKTKTIAIANKESIICGWDLIQKKLKKHKTSFIPVDSEHFSIWSLIKKQNYSLIDKIYITASGGPFLKWPVKKIMSATPSKALKHPNWSMGKKISIDSATMMNKVFEVIETQKIFNLPKSKIKILIHDKSYIHAIVKFKNGIIKLLAHETNMKIPIFNSIYHNTNKSIKSKNLDIKKLNNLNLKNVDTKRFSLTKILKIIPNKNTLFETVIISANDELVNLFLKNKISYSELHKKLLSIINFKVFKAYKNKKPLNIGQISRLNNSVRLKIRELCI
ncbi:1-deoxy-D-xylulose-5-phosphate reductoisomerase [Pelagibacterales bacterium SAG-MED39]|nr:1-deoxy-D-xylulose-5-phosphate reductoisomerase [Pelagibacterales bacterium SAG-MED39]